MCHCGYYNDKSNRIFIQAQLFCAPTEYTDVLRLPRSIMKGKGKDVTQGRLDRLTLLELRDDLINNWDIHYSNPKYRPCKNVSGGPVDRTSNMQIYKKHFTQVPLLKNMVDTFEICFFIFLLTWYGCYSNQKKVMGFRGGTQTFCWVNKSPRLLLLMLEVKRETMKRPPGHSTRMYLLR